MDKRKIPLYLIIAIILICVIIPGAIASFIIFRETHGTPTSGGYDLVVNACEAKWYYFGGMMQPVRHVSCPSQRDNKAGIVNPVENVTLSNGEIVGPTILLWGRSSNGSPLTLNGEFPLYQVGKGDHFTALVGCSSNQTACEARIEISFWYSSRLTTGKIFWSNIVYNQPPQPVDLDLSNLAGEVVFVVIKVDSKSENRSQGQVAIIAPRIEPGIPLPIAIQNIPSFLLVQN